MTSPDEWVYRAAAREWLKGSMPARLTRYQRDEIITGTARTPRLRRIVDTVWQAAAYQHSTVASDALRRLNQYLRTKHPSREFVDPVAEVIRLVDSLGQILDDITHVKLSAAAATRGSPVEEWLEWQRDNRPADSIEWGVLNDLLRDYRALADRGLPLTDRTSGVAAVLDRDGGVEMVNAYQVAYRAAYRAVLPFVDGPQAAVYVCDRLVPAAVAYAAEHPRWCRLALRDGRAGERTRWRPVDAARFRSTVVLASWEGVDASLRAMARALLDAAEDVDGESEGDGKVEA